MSKNGRPRPRGAKAILLRLAAFAAVLCMLPAAVFAENAEPDGWTTFLLICNEGMNNDKGNAGNTMMVVSINAGEGKIRLLQFTWDTFVHYEGYDVPQKLDMPYRNAGPEEALRVFNENFGTDIKLYMSLNYLNLASLIDAYGGVTVEVTRAERNALNGMVASKKNRLQEEAGMGLLTQAVIDALANDYYLNDYGPDTHLNGLQAVGFGVQLLRAGGGRDRRPFRQRGQRHFRQDPVLQRRFRRAGGFLRQAYHQPGPYRGK